MIDCEFCDGDVTVRDFIDGAVGWDGERESERGRRVGRVRRDGGSP